MREPKKGSDAMKIFSFANGKSNAIVIAENLSDAQKVILKSKGVDLGDCKNNHFKEIKTNGMKAFLFAVGKYARIVIAEDLIHAQAKMTSKGHISPTLCGLDMLYNEIETDGIKEATIFTSR